MSQRLIAIVFLSFTSALLVGVTSAEPAEASSVAPLAQSALHLGPLQLKDLLHSGSLAAGVMAVLYTYTQMWRNLRQ